MVNTMANKISLLEDNQCQFLLLEKFALDIFHKHYTELYKETPTYPTPTKPPQSAQMEQNLVIWEKLKLIVMEHSTPNTPLASTLWSTALMKISSI